MTKERNKNGSIVDFVSHMTGCILLVASGKEKIREVLNVQLPASSYYYSNKAVPVLIKLELAKGISNNLYEDSCISLVKG